MKVNPILQKEIKVKMRNWKAAGMIVLYLVVLMVAAVYVLMVESYSSGNIHSKRENFIMFYIMLSVIQYLMIAFIIPAITSGAISGERERQTLDLLLCTNLKPIKIITGKLVASLSQIILLIFASLPIFSLTLIFGGVTIGNVLMLFLHYVITSMFFGCIGIFWSTIVKRTTVATVLTYVTILFLTVGIMIITVLWKIFQYNFMGISMSVNSTYNFWLMYLNPGVGFFIMMFSQLGFMNAFTPMGIGTSYQLLWIGNLLIMFILSVLLIFYSSRKLNPLRKGKKAKK